MNATRFVTDQLGREIQMPARLQRIVSLVPSQTELLFDLGLDDEIAGITWFCIHPADKVKDKAKIGGTKNVKLDKVRALLPELIIANKEENEREQILALAEEFPVWVSDINTLDDALEMMKSLGDICQREAAAERLVSDIQSGFNALPEAPPLRTLYLIWREPFMSIGADTFIHHILGRCGLINCCGDKRRYPMLDELHLRELAPELVLLSSEPYPFKEKHISELRAILPKARIELVDGEMFSWYGSRLLRATRYLKEFISDEAK